MSAIVPMTGAWTLQQKDTALQGRLHDGALLVQANSGGAAAVANGQWRDGVIATTTASGLFVDLQVVAKSSPDMSVNVLPGNLAVTRSGQGPYTAWSVGSLNVTFAASDPTNPRIDLVCAQVIDAAQGDSGTQPQIVVVTGIAKAIPLTSDAALPANAVPLAYVRVNATVTTITNANITDARKSASVAHGIRPLMAGDALADPGFRVGELRDSTAIANGTGIDRWNGTSWDTVAFSGAWIAYSPSMHGMNNNAGAITARYRRIGKSAWGNIKFLPAATADLGTGIPSVDLPFQASSAAAGLSSGTGRLLDASGSNRPLWGTIDPNSTTISLYGLNSSLVHVSPGSAGYTWNNSSGLDITFGPYECV